MIDDAAIIVRESSDGEDSNAVVKKISAMLVKRYGIKKNSKILALSLYEFALQQQQSQQVPQSD